MNLIHGNIRGNTYGCRQGELRLNTAHVRIKNNAN